MALRADTARHIITGVTVLVFSAAAIGTAMRYQERTGPIQMPSNVELPAREAIPTSPSAAPAPAGYIDVSRGSGADIAAKLDGTVALGEATAWPYREGGGAAPANAGSAGWWGKTSAGLTPTSGRSSSRAGGSGGMSGGGYTVASGVNGNSANAPNGPKADRPASGNGRGNSGGSGGGSGNGSAPVFNNHAPSVGDLVDDTVAGLGDVAAPGVGVDVNPGGLSHTPEPTSLLLMATGVAGVLGAVRRRRQARRG